MKKNIIAVFVIIAVSVGFFVFKSIGTDKENTWICVGGEWIQQGNPTSSIPLTGCGDVGVEEKEKTEEQNIQQVQQTLSGEFKNGEAYTTYATNEFEVKYPADWLPVEQSQIVGGVVPEIAVTNIKCSFVIKKTPLPQGSTFREYVENLAQVEMKKMPIKIVKQEIGDTTAYFESEILMGGTTVTSISRSFLTSKGNSVGVAFLAQNVDFEQSCRPVVAEIFESIAVK